MKNLSLQVGTWRTNDDSCLLKIKIYNHRPGAFDQKYSYQAYSIASLNLEIELNVIWREISRLSVTWDGVPRELRGQSWSALKLKKGGQHQAPRELPPLTKR